MYVCINCSIGIFGDIRVLFNVQSTSVARLATADGSSLLSYFDSPISDVSLDPSSLLQVLPGSVSVDVCAQACLSDRTCLSFSIHIASGVCELYLAIQTPETTLVTQGALFYLKFQERVS